MILEDIGYFTIILIVFGVGFLIKIILDKSKDNTFMKMIGYNLSTLLSLWAVSWLYIDLWEWR